MSYLLTFVPKTAAYRAHAAGCSAAISTKRQVRLDQTFESVAAAREWAHADESAKAGQPARANFKACACTHA
jgi:hypothetical protein